MTVTSVMLTKILPEYLKHIVIFEALHMANAIAKWM